jgi:hypothetical integral membrane protein (TIGR02206 family)
MKLKLSGLEPFDAHHLIAIFFSVFIIITIPFIGKVLKQKNRKKFIYILISVALLQEIVDYIARYNFDGFNFAEDLPLHICSYALFMSAYSLYFKNQFCFEFSYLLGVTGTFIAILTPEFNDFDGWVMYVTYFMHHSLIPTFSLWNIYVDGMSLRKLSIPYSLIFLAIIAVPVGIICWLTGGNYMYLARIPNVENPLVFGEWPFYLIYLNIIGVILMIVASSPFYIFNYLNNRSE